MAFGITTTGFNLKRLYDIKQDLVAKLSLVKDPSTNETLTINLQNENDPLVQIINSVSDELSVCWEQLEVAYNQFDPLKATGAGLSALVQLNGILRNAGETDTELRLRQQAETSNTAYRHVDAIYARIVDIATVTFCRVYQNSTLTDPDARGIAAKTICAVVVGGTDIEIADALFNTVPIGVGYHGSTTVSCADTQGFLYDVSFQRPTAIAVNVEVRLSVTDAALWSNANSPGLIKIAILDYAEYGLQPNVGFAPGVSVLRSRLYTPVNTVQGHVILSIKLSTGTDATADADVTIAWDEVASFAADKITITVV